MTRVQFANNILVHIIMLLFESHPVYRQLKKLVKTYALINMVRHFPVLRFPDPAIPCEVVRHFPVLHFQVVHFQAPLLASCIFILQPISCDMHALIMHWNFNTFVHYSKQTRNRRQAGRKVPPPEHARTHRRTDRSKT